MLISKVNNIKCILNNLYMYSNIRAGVMNTVSVIYIVNSYINI